MQPSIARDRGQWTLMILSLWALERRCWKQLCLLRTVWSECLLCCLSRGSRRCGQRTVWSECLLCCLSWGSRRCGQRTVWSESLLCCLSQGSCWCGQRWPCWPPGVLYSYVSDQALSPWSCTAVSSTVQSESRPSVCADVLTDERLVNVLGVWNADVRCETTACTSWSVSSW